MSLAIKFGDESDITALSGAIYFDVVTKYSKSLTGKVTDHPIEAGASITDHFISANPSFNISGVISHVDFSSIPSMVYLEGVPVKNNDPAPQPVVINNAAEGLSRLIPGVVSQFLPKQLSSVIAPSSPRQNHRGEIEQFFSDLMHGLVYNDSRKRWENRMTVCSLYEMDGAIPSNPIRDLICTSVQVDEDASSGDALYLNLSFEKVRFVTLEKVDAPKPQAKTSTARATAEKKNMGTKPPITDSPTDAPKADRATVQGMTQRANQALDEASR